jgi:hypothetical protein
VIFKRQYLAEKRTRAVLKINDFEYVKGDTNFKTKEIRTFNKIFFLDKAAVFQNRESKFYFDDSDKYTCRFYFS